MKSSLLLVLTLLPLAVSAQTKIPTEQEAKIFFANANEESIETLTLSDEDGPLYDLYSQKNPGDIIITGTEICQVIGPQIHTVYHCFAISFDKGKDGVKEVENLQKTIMAKFKFGTSFEELQSLYATPERTHDMEISYDDMPDGQFKTALDEHKPGEIFVVELSDVHSFVMTIKSPPVKQKLISVKRAVYQ